MLNLGFVSAILADNSFEEVISFAAWKPLFMRGDNVLAGGQSRAPLCRGYTYRRGYP
jgi:hypothetical protein